MNDQATAPAKADHADCIFCKIADGQIPARKIHEDDKAVVFHDINPSAPVHFLIIPKQHVVNLYDGAENPELLGHLMSLCGPLAREQGLQDGFKVQINNGLVSAHAPRPMTMPYTATKHAMTGLTKAASLDGRALPSRLTQFQGRVQKIRRSGRFCCATRGAGGKPLNPIAGALGAAFFVGVTHPP